MLETAPSDVASRFPRNCRASQPVSKPWKLLKISLPPRGGFLHVFLHVFFNLTSLKFHSLLLLLSEYCTLRDGFLQYSTEPRTVKPDCFVGVSAKWRKACPTANFLVRYTKKETNGEMTEGQEEARVLSAANYGRDEWWLLLNPVQESEAGGSL